MKQSKMPAIICLLLTIMVGAYMSAALWFNVDPEVLNATRELKGAMQTLWAASVYFFVGSSKGSADKNELLKK